MPTDMTRIWYTEACGPGQDRGTAVRDGCPVCCVYIVKSSGDGVVGINSAGPAGRWDQNRLISRTSPAKRPAPTGSSTCSVRLKTRTLSRFGCVVGAGLLGVRHRPPRSFQPLSAGATLNLCCRGGLRRLDFGNTILEPTSYTGARRAPKNGEGCFST
jgi:hypothetical protein